MVRNVLEPRIVGKQMGLHPMATLISMIAGLKLCGFVGLISGSFIIACECCKRHGRGSQVRPGHLEKKPGDFRQW
ncbi:AI-2E family transporter [Blautia sp.]|uniref:AI-2E family transporter n=1 Tax=Blautia sp. TaxID=1955243 RepID=UPI003A16F9E9